MINQFYLKSYTRNPLDKDHPKKCVSCEESSFQIIGNDKWQCGWDCIEKFKQCNGTCPDWYWKCDYDYNYYDDYYEYNLGRGKSVQAL